MLTYKFNCMQFVGSYSTGSNKLTTKWNPYLFGAVQIAMEIHNLGTEWLYDDYYILILLHCQNNVVFWQQQVQKWNTWTNL